MLSTGKGNDWADFKRFKNYEVQYVADNFCDGSCRVFIEWDPDGDYFFKVRPIKSFEWGTDKAQLYTLVGIAEKQAKINDREFYGDAEETRNYYAGAYNA